MRPRPGGTLFLSNFRPFARTAARLPPFDALTEPFLPFIEFGDKFANVLEHLRISRNFKMQNFHFQTEEYFNLK